jgi:hypothetical protein
VWWRRVGWLPGRLLWIMYDDEIRVRTRDVG